MYRNLAEIITKNAEKYGEKECLFFREKRYTFTEVKDIVHHAAGVLQKNGVARQDRVALLIENSPEFIFAYFAVQSVGAIAVPTNVFLKDREIAGNLNDCAAKYLITTDTFADRVKQLPELIQSLEKVFTFSKCGFSSVVIEGAVSEFSYADPSPEDLAMVLYTSGTTGKPKGAMLSHRNLLSNANSFTIATRMADSDRMLAMLPMFHATSLMCCVITPLSNGADIVILESILEVSKDYYPEMLKTLKPSLMVGVPALFASLSRVKKSVEARANFPFRLCACGGAPLPVEIINNFKEVYGVLILEGYGLSEASPALVFNPVEKQKVGSIGLPVKDVEVKIVDEEGRELPPDTAGELIAKGPNIMRGYWDNKEESAKSLKDGWLYTGDVAVKDEDGFIFIVDRIKDLILVKGINVYPREIEELLYKYVGVLSCAVVGVPDGEGSEIPVAYLKLDAQAGVNMEALKEFLRHNLASYKIPRRFVVTDDIPVNAGGKVLKRELRERARREFNFARKQ